MVNLVLDDPGFKPRGLQICKILESLVHVLPPDRDRASNLQLDSWIAPTLLPFGLCLFRYILYGRIADKVVVHLLEFRVANPLVAPEVGRFEDHKGCDSRRYLGCRKGAEAMKARLCSEIILKSLDGLSVGSGGSEAQQILAQPVAQQLPSHPVIILIMVPEQ